MKKQQEEAAKPEKENAKEEAAKKEAEDDANTKVAEQEVRPHESA